MAKRPEKKREHEPPAETRVLPMQLKIGDRLTDETGEWEVIGRPYTTAGGTTARVRVKKVGQLDERVAVKTSKNRRRVMGRLSPVVPFGTSPGRAVNRRDPATPKGGVVQDFGRIVRSARSRICRAISIGSPISTNLAASSQTSYCAARISSAMMRTARSLWFRLMSPIRYQTLVARSWASMGGRDVNADETWCARARSPKR